MNKDLRLSNILHVNESRISVAINPHILFKDELDRLLPLTDLYSLSQITNDPALHTDLVALAHRFKLEPDGGDIKTHDYEGIVIFENLYRVPSLQLQGVNPDIPVEDIVDRYVTHSIYRAEYVAQKNPSLSTGFFSSRSYESVQVTKSLFPEGLLIYPNGTDYIPLNTQAHKKLIDRFSQKF